MVATQGDSEDSRFQRPDQLGQEQTAPLYIECRDLFKIHKRSELEVVALRGLDLEFETIDNLKSASVESLKKVEGIGDKMAEQLHKVLHKL